MKRWTALFFVLTCGLFLISSAVAAGDTVEFRGCGGDERVEPTEVVLTCADAKLRVEQLEWSQWESMKALATGVLTYPDCTPRVPLVRCKKYAHDPITFKLWQPKYCRQYESRVFTQAVVIDESAPTPATVARDRVKCRMSWIVGDLSFSGRGMIWITYPENRPFWNFSYRVIRFNEYCAVVGGTDCKRTYVKR